MKKTMFALLALPAFALPASAFSIDFSGLGLAGTRITDVDTLTLNVAGYGDVVFSTPVGQEASINNFFGTDSIELPPNNTIIINFLSGPVQNIAFVGVGQDPGEALVLSAVTATSAQIQMVNNSPDKVDGMGVAQISFDANSVPEPSVGLLGALAFLTLLRRRR